MILRMQNTDFYILLTIVELDVRTTRIRDHRVSAFRFQEVDRTSGLRGDLFQIISSRLSVKWNFFPLLDKSERRGGVRGDIAEAQDIAIDGRGTDNNQLMLVIKHQ